MKKVILIIVVVVVVLGLLFLGIRGCKKNGDTQPTNTAVVEMGNISKTVVATGKIEALYKAEIKSKIGGLIKQFYVEEGDKVSVGQKLVEIIPGATPVELVRARTEVKAAAYDKGFVEKKYLRSKKLHEQNLISPEEYDQAKANYQIAKARFFAAMAQLRVLEQGSNVTALVEGIEISEQDQREIEKETREAIASMTVIAPISGIILSRDTDKGSAVIPISSAYGGTVIMTIADVSEKHFRGDVDEADIGKVHLGLPARIYVETYPDESFKAELTHISPMGREEDDIINFEIRATIEDLEDRLRVGMSADAELILEEHENVLVIPEGAIIYEDGKIFVNIQDDSVPEGLRKIEITKGISDGLRTEVLSGLEEGQVVVLPQ
ncbi:MAG: HlyD family efflux transporter periplasmic adaptor subunit [Candidatus Aminicenantes bacterium]|nr:MAG: HlyD family efflux transporter periplasmic adaptor subunit [Candidatus Aminicenantes bacterium]